MANSDEKEELLRLIGAVGLGDTRAYRELYDRAAAKLFGVALRILRDRVIAEDVVQDAFVNIWNGAAGYNAALSAPMTWLITIVRNRCLDYLRRGDRAEVELDDELAATLTDERPGPEARLLVSEDAALLKVCLARLEAGQRQAIAFAYFQGLSHSELAHAMQVPIGTVKTWIRRGLSKLRECLAHTSASGV